MTLRMRTRLISLEQKIYSILLQKGIKQRRMFDVSTSNRLCWSKKKEDKQFIYFLFAYFRKSYIIHIHTFPYRQKERTLYIKNKASQMKTGKIRGRSYQKYSQIFSILHTAFEIQVCFFFQFGYSNSEDVFDAKFRRSQIHFT